MLTAILAATSNYIIGDQRGLPWRCAPDLAFFKAQTQNATLLLGSTTYRLMAEGWPPGRKFLPGRQVIVVSTKPADLIASYIAIEPERLSVMTIEQARELNSAPFDVYVGGGAAIFEELIGICGTMYLTTIIPPNSLEPTSQHVILGPKAQAWIRQASRSVIKQDIDPITQVRATIERLIPNEYSSD